MNRARECFFWCAAAPAVAASVAGALAAAARWIPATAPVPGGIFLERSVSLARPEPLEQAGYLLAIVLPAALFFAARWAAEREGLVRAFDSRAGRAGAGAAQAALAAFVIAMLLAQRAVHEWFGPASLILAAAAAAGCCADAALGARFGRACDAGLRRAGGSAVPLAIALCWTLSNLSTTLYPEWVPAANEAVRAHLPYALDEFAAILNGRTSQVDFFPQYQNLLSYLLAPVFGTVGLTTATFTSIMAILSCAALLLLFDLLRRVTENAWRALALYLPILWLSFCPNNAPDPTFQWQNLFTYPANAPIRYLGPFLTLWLLGRYLRAPDRRRGIFLFFVATLGAVNNLDFGVPALAAAAVAVLLREGAVPTRRWSCEAARMAAFGAAPAVGTALALTLIRSGRWPDARTAILFQRIYAEYGFLSLPMPRFGIHWVVWLLFVGALAKGLFLGAERRLERGLLLFCGVFGCGILSYYVGRSHWATLGALFPVAGLAVSLLFWTALRDQRAARRRIGVPLFLLAGGWALLATKVVTTPNPLEQIRRLTASGPAWWDRRPMVRFLQARARPGEPVEIVLPFAHLVAREAGLDNVYPFASDGSMALRSQLDLAVAAIDANRVRLVLGILPPEFIPPLRERGFRRESGLLSPLEFWVR